LKHPFRRKNLSPRLLPLYVLAAAAFVFARPAPAGFAIGAGLVGCGMALRIWGAGHLVKTDRLTISGPYAHLRHPLYAGTGIVALGFAIMAGGGVAWVGILVLLPFFLLYYVPYKERIESARLERRYGAAYQAYRDAVGALLPTLAPWGPPDSLASEGGRRWSLARFRANSEEYTLVAVGVAVTLLALHPAFAR